MALHPTSTSSHSLSNCPVARLAVANLTQLRCLYVCGVHDHDLEGMSVPCYLAQCSRT